MTTLVDSTLPYSTAPLDPSKPEIRLVELQHSEATGPPTCILRSCPVNGPRPRYTALSYAWGKYTRYDDINLNGKPFPVSRNLWHFLEQMRRDGIFGLCWIDAISTDQANVEERNHQVQMMREIYSGAELVIAWLGEEDTTALSNVAMDFLVKRDLRPSGVYNPRRFWSAGIAKAVLALCERQYWTRIWIVQELWLARDVLIYCGLKTIPWRALQSFFDEATRIFPTWGRHLSLDPVLGSAAANIVIARSSWDGKQKQPLVSLIRSCRDQSSTDIRDTNDMTVDYGLTSEQLLVATLKHVCPSFGRCLKYRRAGRHMLRTSQLLRDVLQIHYNDQELATFIDTEVTRMSVEDESKKAEGLREQNRIQAGESVMDVGERSLQDQSWVQDSKDESGHCYFAFLHYSFQSSDPVRWSEHCMENFLLHEPSQSITCTLCDPKKMTEISRNADFKPLTEPYSRNFTRKQDLTVNGWTLWTKFLHHVQQDHASICFPHVKLPLRTLCHQLLPGNIINYDEYKDPIAKDVLLRIPARYISAAAEDDVGTEMTGPQREIRWREKKIAKRLVEIYAAVGERMKPGELISRPVYPSTYRGADLLMNKQDGRELYLGSLFDWSPVIDLLL